MKGKRTFTTDEYHELKRLIAEKVVSDRDQQKRIRRTIRKIGFHWSDFSSKKGYDVHDLEALVQSAQIQVIGQNALKTHKRSSAQQQHTKPTRPEKPSPSPDLTADPFAKGSFKEFSELDQSILDQTGLYAIRLKPKAKLPIKYQMVLEDRDTRIIYIGKAQGQSLRDRLDQEVLHKSPGTFFRSIGAVLGYLPILGHLIGKANQKNYKFSKPDTEKISKWLINNAEFCICMVNDFGIEGKLIEIYCPLLNDKRNPQRLAILAEDRQKCRDIATGRITV